jgi:hypothetical protein
VGREEDAQSRRILSPGETGIILEHEAAMILRLSSNENTCSESRVTKARCW